VNITVLSLLLLPTYAIEVFKTNVGTTIGAEEIFEKMLIFVFYSLYPPNFCYTIISGIGNN
jgi:hypothetical protein